MNGRDETKPALEEDELLSGGEAGASPTSAGRPQVVLLPEARAEQGGLVYRRGSRLFVLPWRRIAAAHAAEVGEPQGVRTVVFDLLLSGRSGGRCRLDADPGPPACALGRAIAGGLGRASCTASLRAVADEGYATRSYPDLDSFEEDAPPEFLRSA